MSENKNNSKNADNDVADTPLTKGALAALSRIASRTCLWVSGLGLIVITCIILWQVFARYVLNASPSWSEQLALYILVWTILTAAAAGVREGFHIRITAAQDALGKTYRKVTLAFAHLITGAVGVYLIAYGVTLVSTFWPYAIPTLGLPRGSAFLPIPLAGALIVFFSIEHIFALTRNEKVAPEWR